jgi:hypothetical protein
MRIASIQVADISVRRTGGIAGLEHQISRLLRRQMEQF